ncbi:hypothetical protein VitviT2T_009275 [Vitis vinifera]|uniref:PGG domain-containing protein n=1 Tax=Vitis vinifera TaxID=29760 RepID=A0ABY9C4C1_VITVI|nr:hypothetical protein VitviT2T_009275 [Vitis vinifera]
MASTRETRQNMEVIKKKLFRSAMQGKWDEVVNIYKENEEVHMAKITKSGDTALHVAVSDDQARIVEQLLLIIRGKAKVKEVLKIQNERGNTILHLAASMGSMEMCKCIADALPDLIGARNHDSETPLFLAALHGKKEAFICLDEICGLDKGNTYCRRNDGDTILHCAIAGEYFDLAFQIISRYKNLVNSVNEQGLSPLHLLATKHSAFRSGSHFRWFTNIIYHCIFVEKLEEETFKQEEAIVKTFDEEKDPLCPENYQTCINFLRLPWSALTILFDPGNRPNTNLEQSDQKTTNANTGKDPGTGGQADLEDPSGFKAVKKVRQKKEKHVWAAQILDELLCHASFYEYEDNGRNPQQPSQKKDADTTPYSISDDHGVSFDNTLESQHLPGGTAAQPSSATNQQGEDKGAPADRSSPEAQRKQNDNGKNKKNEQDKKKPSEMERKETPLLVAAKNGVVEIVERILELFPVAIHDKDYQKKNIVLLAVEYRQPHVYELLVKRKVLKDAVFRHVDIDGNSALHLAAMLGENKPWLIPGAALQMQWEIKWYEFVKRSVPQHFFVRCNQKGETAKDIFTEKHMDLVQAGGEWLFKTSESCSVVAALIATVAFATSSTVPGGVKEKVGTPTLEDEPAFDIFAISSLVALCFSVNAVIMFLAILTSRYQERDFRIYLPRKLLVGLTSLFVSIASMLISFCAGHYFVLMDKLQYTAILVYAVTCLPVIFFAVAQFPLYFDLMWATFKKVPQRSYKVAPL